MNRKRIASPSCRARMLVLALPVLVALPAFAKGQKISIADDPTYKEEGKPSLVFIEIGDFQCPVCRQGAFDLVPKVHDAFVQSGQVELVFLDKPLSMHGNAFRAAQAGACAQEQDRFWDLHHEMFEHQTELSAGELPARAEAAGLDVAAFQACLATPKHDGAIREDIRTAESLGIEGTPGYVIGRRIEGGDKVEVLEVIHGFIPFEEVAAKIKAHLPAETGKQEPKKGAD
jgi:protein-disulfide isomerase